MSSYLTGSLAGMTKRRNSSPYPHPPTEFCRELMSKGWRRCYAERLDVVRIALAHADDASGVRIWAARAADALALEPVLAGALNRFVRSHDVQARAFRLFLAAPKDKRAGLATLFLAAAKAAAVDRLVAG